MPKWSAALETLVVVASMLFTLVGAIAPIAAPVGPHLSDLRFAPVNPVGSSVTSNNWAGYAVTGTTGSVTRVSAHWVEPAVRCGTVTSIAAFWVGIDGFSSSTVEQTGTLAECISGSALYVSWWETYPTNSVQVFGSISAGDHFSASVVYHGGTYTMSITDTTTSTTWTQNSTVTATRTSAEWIAEAPCCVSGTTTYPLPNFGHVTFTSARATVSGHSMGVGNFSSSVAITMVTTANKDRAVPSTFTTSTSFRVTWKHS